jgi:hypothetical protein
VFVGFLCLYLLTIGRSPPLGDAIPMWEAAQSLVRHGSFAIATRWPINAPLGRGGHYYPVTALLACLVLVPGAILQAIFSAVAPARAAQLSVLTSQLGPVALGALTPALLFRLLLQAGYSRRQAAWTALLLGAGTSIWVYAHRPYSEAVQTVCFVLFLGTLLRAAETPTRACCVRLGLAVALLINSKNIYFACLPGALLFLFLRLRARPRELRAGLLWAAAGLAPGLVALAAYNFVRWGSIANSGYGAVTEGAWRESVFFGVWGQLLSPGRSLFLFSPPLVLGLFGIRRLVKRRPAVALAIALTVFPLILVYARYLFWSGDWGWGPRYLVFALPALIIPVAELVDATPTPLLRRWRRFGLVAALLAGLAVQGLGMAFYWDDFISIARRVQYSWLGRPDLRGSMMAPYPCFSCFDELYSVQWLPAMQPIEGHAWLLRHKLAHDDWRAAQRDAPWERYTSLTFNIREPYDYATIDWWPLFAPPGRRLPLIILSGLFLLSLIPLRVWAATLRAPPTSDGDPEAAREAESFEAESREVESSEAE